MLDASNTDHLPEICKLIVELAVNDFQRGHYKTGSLGLRDIRAGSGRNAMGIAFAIGLSRYREGHKRMFRSVYMAALWTEAVNVREGQENG